MALTRVDVYSSSQIAQEFSLSGSGIEEDLFQVLNIDGLDPAKASINMLSLASGDGSTVIGTDLPSRNIVLTIKTNPNWDNYSHENLRQRLYEYFVPKNEIKMIFISDELPSVEILGVVESIEANPFTQDPQFLVSIVCPDPHFTAVDPTIINGTCVAIDDWPPAAPISIGGDIPVGFRIDLSDGFTSGDIGIQVGDPAVSAFRIYVPLSDPCPGTNIFRMDSRPLHKYVRTIEYPNGVITNLLRFIQDGSAWPYLEPGDNLFAVMGPTGNSWQLKYYAKYGGF